MGKVGRIDLAKIARQKTVLLDFDWSAMLSQHLFICVRSRTFAISSLFLSSPSTITTLPFSSTSVHLSLGSIAAFAVKALRWKIEPDSSSSATLMSSSFSRVSGGPFFSPLPNSHSLSLGLLESQSEDWFDENRSEPAGGGSARRDFVVRCFRSDLGRMASRSTRPARNSVRLGGVAVLSDLVVVEEEGCLGGLVEPPAVQAWRHWRAGCRSAVARHVGANESPSDWARRYRRRLRDGAAGLNAGGIAAKMVDVD